jgi:uncharacterized protein
MRKRSFLALFPALLAGAAVFTPAQAADALKVLILDGQNNHAWKDTTPWLEWILDRSGRFTVDIATSPGGSPRGPKNPGDKATPEQKAEYDKALKDWLLAKEKQESENKAAWEAWKPDFAAYDVIVSNYNGEMWPEPVRKSFVEYVAGGGGLVVVHAANNSFPEWPEYNLMIGLGGWGGRNEKSGPMVRFREGSFQRDTAPGSGGSHGKQHEFVVELRQPTHPIVAGLPAKWKHSMDELYSRLRGPAENLEIIATAWDDPATNGTGENEPILMTVGYGKGRVFHTTLGHSTQSMASLGFQITLQRGTEWAATGKVTMELKEEIAKLSVDAAAVWEKPVSKVPDQQAQ